MDYVIPISNNYEVTKMKYRLFSLTLLVLGLLVLAGCSDDNMMTAPDPSRGSSVQTYRLVEDSEPGRGTSFPIMIVSSVDAQAGYIMVSNDARNLYLRYNMVDSWRLLDSNIHVARSMNEIHMDEAGKPIVERFSYSFNLDRGLSTYTYRIPLEELRVNPGQSIAIASYASVYETGANTNELAREGLVSGWWFTANYRISNFGIDEDARGELEEFVTDIKLER